MQPTTIQSEKFALDGPIHIAVAAVVIAVLLCLFAWSLRRERDVIGRRNTLLFWGLRTVAACVALWMLLAPSMIRSERTTTRQSVAIVVDTSLSMGTIDPPDAAEDLRWSIATDSATDGSATAGADRAVAAALLAEQRLTEAVAAWRDQQPEWVALQFAADAHRAIQRTRDHAREIATRLEQLSSRPGSDDSMSAEGPSQQVAQVLQMLDGTDYRALGSLATNFLQGREALQAGWRESLVDVQHQTVGMRRRLVELAHAVAMLEDAMLEDARATDLRQLRQLSRLERVSRFVRSIDSTVLQSIRETANVRHALFDGSFTPLADHEDLSLELDRFLERVPGDQGEESAGAASGLPVTNLTGALERIHQMRSEQPVAAVILLTDGGHNQPDGRDPRDAAGEIGTPVYVVPIGNTRRVRDVDLKSVSAPSVVMKDDDVVIEAAIGAYDCEGERLRVELLRNGAVIQHHDVPVDSATALMRVRFNARISDVGMQTFQLRVVPLEGELSEENNFEQFQVNVTRNHISVLLADGLPRWEYRYLAHLFRRDQNVQCDELLFQPREIATGSPDKRAAFPTTVDDWAQYDVILLGDVSPEQLPVPAQESLVEFVRQRGGTLVMIAGDEYLPGAFVNQPLEALLPVTRAEHIDPNEAREGYAFQVTADGWKHHALMIADTESSTRIAWDFVNRHSPLYALSPFRRARPSARTLIAAVPRAAAGRDSEGAENALLCWQPAGRGRIVFLASPETFRLRYLRGDRLHYRFWGQLLRWAIASDLGTGSELIRIRTDRPDYRGGDSVQVVVRLKDELGVPVEDALIEAVALDADGTRLAIPLQPEPSDPGRYQGTFDRLNSGIYRVEPKGEAINELLHTFERESEPTPTASFTVRSPLNLEILDTRSDRALARQIAEATGGQVLPPTAVREVLELTDLQPIVEETSQRLPLWVRWKYLWIVFGCLFSEWVVRKRLGLS
jgi:hypothetical protein